MSSKYLFIFEMANNHNGDPAHGVAIVKALKRASEGFDFRFAVKLQYRHLPDFIHPDYRARTDYRFVKRFSETALSWDDYRRIKDAIVEAGFLTVCTPWDEASVDRIVEHGYDFLKVPSCYLTDWPLAEKIALTRLPLIISTAGEPFEEIDRIVAFYQDRNKHLTIMHCVGEYPTASDNLQLNQIDLLRARYANVEIGYSTHEAPDQLDAVRIAIAKQATVFEKHVGLATVTTKLNEYSANPDQVLRWLEAARSAVAICGIEGRRHVFSATEKRTLNELRRAVFARHEIKAGDIIRSADIFLSIPGAEGQLRGNDLSKYTEYRAVRSFAPNDPILRSGVTATDTRSLIHAVVKDAKALLKASGAMVPARFRLEVSHHYGLERFREFGSAAITVVNREYCKRVILVLPGQRHPEQWHKLKDETYHILYGEIDLSVGGEQRVVGKNEVVIIPRGTKHEFGSQSGAVIEEISSAYAAEDSYYTDPAIMKNANRKTYVMNWLDATSQ
jgi:sialic acid synthase SpsE/mannose-6-phosphate isomerase-like protein (cupin superfamily)